MAEKYLSTDEMAVLFRTTPGALRTALWRYRREGIDPGIPVPVLIRRRYWWRASAAEAYLEQLVAAGSGNPSGDGDKNE